MKQLYILLVLALIGLQTPAIQAQELAKKSTFKNGISEKFLVLKKDKSVKHGQYLRIFNDPINKDYLMELGQYDNNQKTGTWIQFYHTTPANSIQAVGDYVNGQKEGSWSYFHELFDEQLTIRPAHFNSNKRTRITPPAQGMLEYTVEVNSENHILESVGHYTNSKKVGVWKYYDHKGNPTQTYNHSTGELLEDLTERPDKAYMTYLGGLNRFRFMYYAAQRGTPIHLHIKQNSEAVFELNENGTYRFVSGSGDDYLKGHAEKILASLPNEWIYAEKDTADKGKLQVTCKVEKSEGKNGLMFYIDFKVAE